jgi:manganese transport system permease protein
VLVVAMLIIPGATARLLTDRFPRMLVIAPTLAAVGAAVGIYASYYADAASGPMIVLAQGAAFLAAYLFAPRGGILRRRRPGTTSGRGAATVTDAQPEVRATTPGGGRTDVASEPLA